jgi:hypothetical protein
MGGNIYYSDTDSIVTDLELPTSMVDPKVLGKLKLEHEVVRGYFIGASQNSKKEKYLLLDSNSDNIDKDNIRLKLHRPPLFLIKLPVHFFI